MGIDLSSIIWLLILFSLFMPSIRQARLVMTRIRLLRSLEEKRGSRVITLVHRQESISFLGIPLSRYINIEDSEQVLRAIRMTPRDMPIDIILHTPGGLVLAAEQIAYALKNHPAKVTVFVPHYAMSGGTLIALAADEIVMDANALLGPVDPQIGEYPAVSVLRAVAKKDPNKVDDETLILADVAEKAMRQVKNTVFSILKDRLGSEQAEEIAALLTEGHWTHDYPLTCDRLAKMGLPACGDMPREIYALMDQFPQPMRTRPSVEFIPVPYGDKQNGTA